MLLELHNHCMNGKGGTSSIQYTITASRLCSTLVIYGSDNFSSTVGKVFCFELSRTDLLFWAMVWNDCRPLMELAMLSVYTAQQTYEEVGGTTSVLLRKSNRGVSRKVSISILLEL